MTVLLLLILIMIIPVCALILTVVMEKHADRIVAAIQTPGTRFSDGRVNTMSVDGRVPDLETMARARLQTKARRADNELPQGCPENNGGDCTEDCGPGMPHCKKRARKLLAQSGRRDTP